MDFLDHMKESGISNNNDASTMWRVVTEANRSAKNKQLELLKKAQVALSLGVLDQDWIIEEIYSLTGETEVSKN